MSLTLAIPDRLAALPASLAPSPELVAALDEAHEAQLMRAVGRADDLLRHHRDGVTELVFVFDE